MRKLSSLTSSRAPQGPSRGGRAPASVPRSRLTGRCQPTRGRKAQAPCGATFSAFPRSAFLHSSPLQPGATRHAPVSSLSAPAASRRAGGSGGPGGAHDAPRAAQRDGFCARFARRGAAPRRATLAGTSDALLQLGRGQGSRPRCLGPFAPRRDQLAVGRLLAGLPSGRRWHCALRPDAAASVSGLAERPGGSPLCQRPAFARLQSRGAAACRRRLSQRRQQPGPPT